MPDDEPRITDFLNGLAAHPARQRRFEREPVAVMTSFGLTEDQQTLILEGTPGEIRDAIREENPDDTAAMVFVLHIKL